MTLVIATDRAAVVALDSNNTDVAKVPSSVTVAVGSRTGTFLVDTSTVAATTVVTIGAQFEGVRQTNTLTVLTPQLTPRFTVSSDSKGSNACSIINGSGDTDCNLDASGSGGVIDQFLYTFDVEGDTLTQNTPSTTARADTTCSLLSGATHTSGTIQMTIHMDLRGRDGSSSSSSLRATRTVTVTTAGFCGY